MNTFTLANHGDNYERCYYHLFIATEFPSYEAFWQRFVVPLTNRPVDIHFKTAQQLNAIGKGDHEICIAQLHYSVLRHLARAYVLKEQPHIDLDELTEGMVRLTGAQDIAFELLERHQNPGQYDPWLATGAGGIAGGREARKAWQSNHSYPLQDIRNYRNHLVHGRLLPGIVGNVWQVPRIGLEQGYFDWRNITHNPNLQSLIGTDLVSTSQILREAWNNTIQHLETEWSNHLI